MNGNERNPSRFVPPRAIPEMPSPQIPPNLPLSATPAVPEPPVPVVPDPLPTRISDPHPLLGDDRDDPCLPLLAEESGTDKSRSYICRELALVMRSEVGMKWHGGTWHLRRVMWTGTTWRIYDPGAEPVGKTRLNNKLVTSWYYGNEGFSRSEQFAERVDEPYNESACTNVEETATLVTGFYGCNNAWHSMHDVLMPIFAALYDWVSGKEWNPADVKVVLDRGKGRECLGNNLLSVVLKHISTQPGAGEGWVQPAAGTCYRSLQLAGSARLNLYAVLSGAEEQARRKEVRTWRNVLLSWLFPEYTPTTPTSLDKDHLKVAWISRTPGSFRAVLNENDAVEALREIGHTVTVVHFEKQSREEQIRTVLDADILIAAHGAGWANFMFMRPQTVAIQLWPWGMDPADTAFVSFPPDNLPWFKGQNFVSMAESVGMYDDWVCPKNMSGYAGDTGKAANPKALWGSSTTTIKQPSAKEAQQVFLLRPQTNFRVSVPEIVALVQKSAERVIDAYRENN